MTLLYSIITICLFIVLLCLIIAISEKFLGQSGDVEICINKDKKFKANKGLKLLSALAENNIYLPAACGGKGNCGRCQLKVLSGGGYPTALEQATLSETDIKAGTRLSCQIKLRENISLEIPQNLLNVQSFKAKLIEIKELAYRIKELHFKLEEGKELDFKAGQYVQITRTLPRESVIRAYSLSSSPKSKSEFTLDVQQIEGGLMSNYLHSLEKDTIIDFCAPFGDMYINTDRENTGTILMVAGGVGLAPMRSIISYLVDTSFKGKIILFHGVRSRKHLYSENDYKKLKKEQPNFDYIPVLSEPALEDGWIGETGLVTQILEEYLNENHYEKATIECFLCGPSKMMEISEKILIEKGIDPTKIHSDPFSF